MSSSSELDAAGRRRSPATIRMGFHIVDDPREKPLREALYRCLDRLPAPAERA